MATINSVQKSIHLPLTSLSSPRVLMCSASVGTEGSVTLQLRDSSDSNQSPAPTSLENALTIGYPDPEMLADVFGSLQTASFKNHSNALALTSPITTTTSHNSNSLSVGSSSSSSSSSSVNNKTTTTSNASSSCSTNTCSNNATTSATVSAAAPSNKITISRRNQTVSTSTTATATNQASATTTTTTSAISAAAAAATTTAITTTNKASVQTVSTATNTTNKTTSSYVKNCLIRSSSCSNTNNVTSLAQIMSNSSTSSSSSLLNHSNTNSNSNCSSNSNFSSSSSSNDSIVSINSNNSGSAVLKSVSAGSSSKSTSASGATTATLKKNRSKLSSPTRHGPQQCQICSKIFGNASALAKHKLTHSDERKYVCAMCSKAFKRQDHLNGHMMTHRNKKPYECKAEGCGKSYCDARSLRRHTENHHSGIITPQNQTLSPTSGTPNGLSLSPATASGDASSPDGATCIRTYISTGGTIVDAATGVALTEEQIKAINLPIKTGVTLLSPTSTSSASSVGGVSLPASSPTIALTETSLVDAGEGLTREQLDLISKIMQQTKQTSAQVTVSSPTSVNSYKVDTNPSSRALGTVSPQHAASGGTSRPRTWNMQLLNTTQNVSITVDETNSDATSRHIAISPNEAKEEDISQQFVASINPHLLNIAKMDQKPVECNLCHRKFKNIPALNGHMRLHGGYFKKDPETKKTEKKESSGPPLQTASIGVRALIEEKIISKRKDMNKGAFVVPAPPSSVSSTSTIRRSISDLESFLSPKSHNNNGNSANTTGSANSPNQCSTTATATTMLPVATTIKSYGGGSLGLQQIGLSQGIEIFSKKQQKTIGNAGLGLGVGFSAVVQANNSTMNPSTVKSAATTNTTTTKGTSTDPKDSTLIELLKRGTRIAVTAKKPLNSTNTLANMTNSSTNNGNGGTRQIVTNNNRTVIIPSDVQVLPTRLAKANANAARTTPGSLAMTDTTPLSLTISQSGDNSMGGDVYTVTYSSDTSGFFDDAEVYNVADTDMLLQTVDSMQLLNDDSQQLKSEHSEQFDTVTGVSIAEGSQADNSGNCVQTEFLKLEVDSNVNTMPNTLPTFQQFHSKELIMQNSAQIQAVTSMRSNAHQLGTMSSPINSPLAYPTPPSSHENMTQSSPYVEDGHQYPEVANAFFNDKCSADFLTQSTAGVTFFKGGNDNQLELTDTEKILKLKTVLEESAFDGSIKVEDLLNGAQDDDTECDLRDFAETNLAFLDEDQEFLNDSRNATSPLPESFFTGSIGTADEVKEVLRDVLPDENINLNCDEQSGENIIDLYYLPGLGLQSQMMPNSDDPLLSSSPRDFGQQRGQVIQTTQQVQVQQQLQQQQQQQLQNQQTFTQNQQIQQSTQQLLYAQQIEHQIQQHQQQASVGGSYVGNHYNVSEGTAANTTLQYNVHNLPQVQNQQQFIEANTPIQQVSSLDGGILHQQLVFTGSTDKQEIHITGQPSEIGLLSTSAALNTDTNIYFASNSNNSNMSSLQQTGNQSITSNITASCQPPVASTVISTLQPLSNQTNSILKRRLRQHNYSDTGSSQSFAKYHPLSPYRSKLRKPSRTHYTPAPILNPDRKGIGLYCSVRKQLNTGMLGFDSFADDFDDPVGLVDFSDESKVNLGSAYQAQIPPCRERIQGASSDTATDGPLCKITSCFEVDEPIGAEQLWEPTVQMDEKILMRYIDLSKSSAVPLGSHSEEVALQTLLNAHGNMAAAVLTLLQTQSNAFQMKWSATELEVFLKGLERHGKDFGRISLELGSKTTGECVQMYYFWKKLCVDYKVSHLKTETPPPPPANDPKPYVCEVPDCSASFTSKAALHGHTRIHTYGRNANSHNNNNNNNNHQNNNNNINNATANTINTNGATIGSSPTLAQQSNISTAQTQSLAANANTGASGVLAKDSSQSGAASAASGASKDTDFPCKVCGKVFNKVKSRSAHMKTHRVQEQQQQHQQQQQQLQQQQQQSVTETSSAPIKAIASAHSKNLNANQSHQQPPIEQAS